MEEKKELLINPLFTPIFQDNISDPRYYLNFGGRASGKSFATSIAMVLLSYSKHQHRILYLRQTMSSSEDSVIEDVKKSIEILNLGSDFKQRGYTLNNLKSGGRIIFKGIRSNGSQTAKLKSLSGITTLIVEEAEEIESFEEFSKIDESIRTLGKPLKVMLLFNPTSAISSWIHKEWFDQGLPKKGRTDTVYLHSTYKDNIENIAPSTVKRFEDLRETNPTYYVNVILAEWTLEAEGQIYAGWKIIEEIPAIARIEGDTWFGLDFGYGGRDKTSLIKITYHNEIYYIEEMFSKAKLSISDTVSNIAKHATRNSLIYADSAMPLLISEIREAGFTKIRKAKKGKIKEAIKKVQNKNIYLVGDDTNIYASYMTFKRDSKDELPHEPDELAAMRYGINSRKPIKNRNAPVVRRPSSNRYM